MSEDVNLLGHSRFERSHCPLYDCMTDKSALAAMDVLVKRIEDVECAVCLSREVVYEGLVHHLI